ncbi:MAG: hypothetical protein CUN49_12070 [Candidatus Thermofonsia Clade 1 bacterium]|jgi:hypothetical protein|uniref:Histidine kinase N-terminal 7TM region domain-containing protein n=1 Tax=Candidatus Thermofonsia Clade 1 bacterium TaxID=2364210 RepID=A0A2M8PC74_9CHLR|nr:MAG: hypothetical protein CUN49_12070 [Candidatus Thermofonsia Clade 1 bacterium]RMF52737.1 MAG: hypothetical protein D6749_04165 [Chloroflexota bacterium]
MSDELFILLSRQINEVLTAATVIVAVSMLLYNLSHGPRDRVTRASSVLLGCVSAIYVGDVLVAISRAPQTVESLLRLQWLGIAFAPAALFHLSDALLATTGLQSRGRRRRAVRVLYAFATLFFILAISTDLIVRDLLMRPLEIMQAGALFPLFVIYFGIASLFAFNNVLRARRRCLTRATYRRMTYLLFALVTPMAGTFPFSLLLPSLKEADAALLWLLINIGNLGIVLMLAFMAYPLAFFGPKKPDRMIKAELLSFLLRGPITGIAVLVVILYVPRLSFFGIPSEALMPFVAVATVMGLQWLFTIIIPIIEQKLIYTEDQEQARQLQALSQHLLTRDDAKQLLEATLAAICDYLRVPSAFVISLNGEKVTLEQQVGPLQPTLEALERAHLSALLQINSSLENGAQAHADSLRLVAWQSFWLIALRSNRGGRLIGALGIWARNTTPDLQAEEEAVFRVLYQRAARVLDDMRLQAELFANLEDIIETSAAVGLESESVRYGNAAEAARLTDPAALDSATEFSEVIWGALRDYWGGARLTDSRLLRLQQVQAQLAEQSGDAAKAVRAVLNSAIEALKPQGAYSLTSAEWMLYNILDLRFIKGQKVRDVARKLAMSDADFYRKQRIAVERVTQVILGREKQLNAERIS